MFDYEVKFQNITVTGGAPLRIRSLFDHKQFYDPDGEAAALGICQSAWPLFGQVWPSGLVLADAVQVHDLAGKRVLEIGCGLGIPSLVACRRGADITAIDQHPLAAEFLRENLVLNALPALRFHRQDWSRSSDALGKFDLIIASDVLYERQQPDTLSVFIDAHAAQRVEVLIIDPNRGYRTSFARRMKAFGYAYEDAPVACQWSDGGRYKGRALRYNR